MRTLALLLGITGWLLALAFLANGVLLGRADLATFVASREAAGGLVALAAGAVLVGWGIRRPRAAGARSEASLNRLIRKYEREGKTHELAEAREQLIQLLVDRDDAPPGDAKRE